jgi:hypothetical protein
MSPLGIPYQSYQAIIVYVVLYVVIGAVLGAVWEHWSIDEKGKSNEGWLLGVTWPLTLLVYILILKPYALTRDHLHKAKVPGAKVRKQ